MIPFGAVLYPILTHNCHSLVYWSKLFLLVNWDLFFNTWLSTWSIHLFVIDEKVEGVDLTFLGFLVDLYKDEDPYSLV